ncbi:MAG: hypothetical protein NXI31_12385 [bacterium]|nr:hypothetical protein [bacterium]
MPANRIPIAAVAALLLPAAALSAQDQLVRQALKKIESVESRLADLPAGDVTAANRLLRDLKWANKRLKAAYKKNTTHWQDAAKRLAAADAAIRERAAAKVKSSGQKGEKGQKDATPQPVAGKQPAGAAKAGPVMGDDFAKLQQLHKEVENGFRNLKMLNKSFMGDAFRVGSTQKELRGLKRRIAEFPAGDTNVQKVQQRLDEFDGLFAKWRAEFAADQAGAAGLQQQMDAIAARYMRDSLPGPMHWPFELDKLRSWAERTQAVLKQVPADVAVLQRASQHSQLGRKAKSLLHRVQHDIPRQLGEFAQQVRYQCDTAVKDSLRVAKLLREISPDDKNAITNRVLLNGALERNVATLQKGMDAVDQAAALDIAFAAEDAPDRKAQRDEIEGTIGVLRKLAKSALTEVRMPRGVKLADEELKKLQAVAATTLAKKKYGTHPIQKLVVTSKLQRKEKTEGDVRGTVTGARITTYHYVWDQFHVVTAEKVGDEVWVYHNLLKYYHSSDTVTPQDVWILSRRFQGTQILAENVDK